LAPLPLIPLHYIWSVAAESSGYVASAGLKLTCPSFLGSHARRYQFKPPLPGNRQAEYDRYTRETIDMRINDPRDPRSLSYKFRSKRDDLLRRTILACARANEPVRILDLGGSDYYWQRFGLGFLRRHRIELTLLNQQPADMGSFPVKRMVADACNVPADDNSFDFVHSNSVIEHVGSWENMQRFAHEVRRLAPSYYVQTPNWWFPIEPHFFRAPFFHWMPKDVRVRILYHFSVAHSGKIRPLDEAQRVVESTRLITGSQMQRLFPDARLVREKFTWLTKSLIAIR
jgi:hypothetical protein